MKRCRRRSSEVGISNDDLYDEESQTTPLLLGGEETTRNGKTIIKRKNEYCRKYLFFNMFIVQNGEEEEHINNIRAITIAVRIFFFYPLILLATICKNLV